MNKIIIIISLLFIGCTKDIPPTVNIAHENGDNGIEWVWFTGGLKPMCFTWDSAHSRLRICTYPMDTLDIKSGNNMSTDSAGKMITVSDAH